MSKELWLEIVNRRLFFEAALIIVVYLSGWFINFKLGFLILGIKIGLKKMFPAIFILSVFVLYARPFLPGSIFGIIMAILVAFLFKIIGKVNIIRAAWCALSILLITAIGDIFIIDLLCYLNKNIATFFFRTINGYIVLGLIEDIFPILALLILPKYNIILIPSAKKKIIGYELIGTITYCAMFYLFSSMLMKIIVNLKTNPQHILVDLIFEWIAMMVIILGHYLSLAHAKREYEFEQQIIQLFKENRELADLNNHLKFKNVKPQEINEAFDGIINKLQNISRSLMNNGSQTSGTDYDNIPAPANLNANETRVIGLVAQGRSNKEIAATMYLSEGRVKNIITNIMGKLGLEDRVQLAVYAVKNNLANGE